MTSIYLLVLYVVALSAPAPYLAPGQDRNIYDVDISAAIYTVEEVAVVVCEEARLRNGDGTCGDWCSPDRAEIAASFPDRSDWRPTDDWCRDFAESAVFWSMALDVHIAEILALAREADFQPYAFGRAGECGIYQQHARYARPEEMREDLGSDVAVCSWLFADVDNQVYSATLRIANYMSRYGNYWPCHYNRGGTCDTRGIDYQNGHYAQRGMVLQDLRDVRAQASSDEDGDGGS